MVKLWGHMSAKQYKVAAKHHGFRKMTKSENALMASLNKKYARKPAKKRRRSIHHTLAEMGKRRRRRARITGVPVGTVLATPHGEITMYDAETEPSGRKRRLSFSE